MEADWREQEQRLNRFAHFRAEVDGPGVHYVHQRGNGPDPLPLVLTHGWPSTFFEFSKLVPLLTDPQGHGCDPADAFDVVVPSLPGYAFSDSLPPGEARRIPAMWAKLMEGLGYGRFGAHGGDIGAMVSSRLALEFPGRIVSVHTTFVAEPYLGSGAPPLTDRERVFLEERARSNEEGAAYAHVQRTRPKTLAS